VDADTHFLSLAAGGGMLKDRMSMHPWPEAQFGKSSRATIIVNADHVSEDDRRPVGAVSRIIVIPAKAGIQPWGQTGRAQDEEAV
jgi:hypothetical protein